MLKDKKMTPELPRYAAFKIVIQISKVVYGHKDITKKHSGVKSEPFARLLTQSFAKLKTV